MSAYPNKLTLIAAAIYGISKQVEVETRAGKKPVVWCDLTPEQKAPFTTVSEFLLVHLFGSPVQTIDRAKLAAAVEEKALIEANANEIVSVFASLASALP